MEQVEEQTHVQLPNNATKDSELTAKDWLIYLYIKSYKKSPNAEIFPSLEVLHQRSGASINTIRKCIQNLVDAGKIRVIKKGRSNYYEFLDKYDKFEPFSNEFLDKKDLTFLEKAQLVVSQQYLFKNPETGDGVTNYSNRQLAEIIKMPESTIRKNLNSLINKGYVEIKEVKDEFTGLVTKQKIYHLTKLEQAIVFILKNHEDRLNSHEEELNNQKEKLEQLEAFIMQNPTLKEQYKQFKDTNITL